MPDVLPAVRMDMYRRSHPEVEVRYTPVYGVTPEEGLWRAHVPLGGTYERVLAGPGLEALLDKLERPAAGG